MLSANTILFFIALLLIASLAQPFANKIRLPFSIVLVLIGFLGSEFTTNILNIDTGVRWYNFKNIIFYVLLPILIFQAAIEINIRLLWKNLIPISIMALPLMVLSAVVTAAALYYAINHPVGFPWIVALITGALLSATDPAAVLALLKQAGAPERLRILLEGESLFNDATAIVLFSILIAFANNHELIGGNEVLLRFAEVFFGGLVTGTVIGVITFFLTKIVNKAETFLLFSIASAYIAFIVTEDILHFSGVIAVLSCGITIGSLCTDRFQENTFVSKVWQLLGNFTESMIFLLAGVTITLSMFVDQWLAILIGIAAVILSRTVMIMGTFPLISLIPGVEPVSFKHQKILVWGGIRGTITLALALSLPLTLDSWYTIQSIAYGVVIFTLFVQTMTMPKLLKD